MNVHPSHPWQKAILDRPPVKLGYQDLVIPEGVDLTFVTTMHSASEGLPDYLEEALAEADIFMPELEG